MKNLLILAVAGFLAVPAIAAELPPDVVMSDQSTEVVECSVNEVAPAVSTDFVCVSDIGTRFVPVVALEASHDQTALLYEVVPFVPTKVKPLVFRYYKQKYRKSKYTDRYSKHYGKTLAIQLRQIHSPLLC